MTGTRIWTHRIRLVLLVALLAGALTLIGWWYLVHWRPSAATYPLQGVDVSADTGAIDWAVVRAGGADFAYIRATAGAAHRDPAFAGNWSAARNAGLRRGALHLYAPCAPAQAQANAFIVTVPRVSDALPAAVALDPDAACPAPPGRAALIAALAQFAKMVEAHTGAPVLLLIPPAVEARYDLSRAFDRPLWATGTYATPDYLNRPWRMWRANARRRIDGADNPVGWDVVAP